ncbi:aminotransferase class V-fold PLP-dependent enzyme [Eionea flava]
MSFDAKTFKAQFPLFSQPENATLTYLDNAATTQVPQCVLDAMTGFYLHQNGNAQRASHRLARSATDMVTQTRQLAADFMGVNDALPERSVVLTSGATESLNLIAYGLASLFNAGGEIVLSAGEHHANLLPWQRLAEQQKSRLVFVPNDHTGAPDWSRWAEVVSERTKVLALSAASNVLGEVIDLSLIARIKQRFSSLIIVLDASQIACHMPLRVTQWQCDFMVCSAHKFYGPKGAGLLYGRPELLAQMQPMHLGGEMVEQAMLHRSELAEGAQRFEAGTSSLSAIAGLNACLQFWQRQDRNAMQAYEQMLTDYLYRSLAAVCQPAVGLRILRSERSLETHSSSSQLHHAQTRNVGIAVIVIDHSVTSLAMSLSDLAHWLDDSNIAVRMGRHCAHTLWQSLSSGGVGVTNGLRVSLAAYNTVQDIDNLIAAITAFTRTYCVATDSSEMSVSSDLVLSSDSVLSDDLSHLCEQDLLDAPSWQKRFKVLVEWGKAITVKPSIRRPECEVRGCESQVWVKHCLIDDRHYFFIDSDANLVKGLSALLLLWFNGKTRETIQAINVEERCQTLGLEKYLSESRMNGFLSIVAVMKRAE